MGHEDTVRLAFNAFYKDAQSALGHYFRTLYNLVDRAQIEDKRFYTNYLETN